MNKLDLDYQNLLQDILDNGSTMQDRTGTGTLSVFGRQIRHKMSDGFPLITSKKMYFKGIVTELLWFLRGDTNIKFLVDNDCHIWDGDAYQSYLKKTNREIELNNVMIYHPHYGLSKEEFVNKIKTDERFAEEYGELGPTYGKQWRRWTKKKMYLSTDGSYENIYDEADQTVIDQISILINELKTNPDSRRLLVSAWNPADLQHQILPPCHYGFQVYTRELSLNDRILEFAKQDLDPGEFRRGGKYGTVIPEEKTLKVLEKHNIPTRAISLMWNQRSVDTGLGLPFNIASYGLLLEILAKKVNMIPEDLIGNLGDCHIYLNQINGIKEQLTRTPYKLPTVKILDKKVNDISEYTLQDITLEDYQSHPAIKMPLSN